MASDLAFLSYEGFLGTGATFAADLNLVVQLIMGTVLIVGTRLAQQKHYKAHGICQTTVLLLNLLMIGLVMWPSFRQQVRPALSKGLHKWYYEAAIMHAALGITAELMGLYIVLVAGTDVLRHISVRVDRRKARRKCTGGKNAVPCQFLPNYPVQTLPQCVTAWLQRVDNQMTS